MKVVSVPTKPFLTIDLNILAGVFIHPSHASWYQVK